MTAVTGATSAIADYVLATGYADLPAAVRKEGLRTFFNVLGCTVGGAKHEAIEATWRALAPFAGEAHATLLGRGQRTDALTASCLAPPTVQPSTLKNVRRPSLRTAAGRSA